MDEGFSLINEENLDDFETLPGRAILQLRVPMICPDCDDVHFIPVTASVVPKEGGVKQLITNIQTMLVERGFLVPLDADMKAWAERLEASMKAAEEMEKDQEAAKLRGAFYISRTGREGGDA